MTQRKPKQDELCPCGTELLCSPAGHPYCPTCSPSWGKPKTMTTLAEALKELGERVLRPTYTPVKGLRDPLRRKVQITAEGIALPNGQLLYRFADREPER